MMYQLYIEGFLFQEYGESPYEYIDEESDGKVDAEIDEENG